MDTGELSRGELILRPSYHLIKLLPALLRPTNYVDFYPVNPVEASGVLVKVCSLNWRFKEKLTVEHFFRGYLAAS